MRDPRFSASFLAEPLEGGEIPSLHWEHLSRGGYTVQVGTHYVVEWLDVDPSLVVIECYADSETNAERDWARFSETAKRAALATLDAPEWILGGFPDPEGNAAGWLCLLAVASWCNGSAECCRITTGESVSPESGSPWFSVIPDLAAASVELIDRMLAAEEPEPSQDPGDTDAKPSLDELCHQLWQDYREDCETRGKKPRKQHVVNWTGNRPGHAKLVSDHHLGGEEIHAAMRRHGAKIRSRNRRSVRTK